MAKSKKPTRLSETVTPRRLTLELGTPAERAELRRTWKALRHQLEAKTPLGSDIRRIQSDLSDLSWLRELNESAKPKSDKPKRRKSPMVELATVLFKEAFPQDGCPPSHFTNKQVEEKIRPFYKKHGVQSPLKSDTMRRARDLLKRK